LIPGFNLFPEGQIIGFALVFLRILAFVVTWPIFGTATVPVPVKVLLALVMSIVLFPVITFTQIDLIKIDDQIIFLAIRELCIGLALGYLMRLFFFTVSIAGEIISVTMGLASAQLYNPAMGSQGNVVEQFQLMLASLFFLGMNGHHVFIGGLAESFHIVPVADIGLKTAAFAGIAPMIQDVFLMGLKMSAPVLIAVFLTNIAMGIVGRAVPQINVLVTGMPVTIMISFGVLIITTPLFVGEMDSLVYIMADRFFQFMKVI
jgi:flagellar biosynthetic protein FliR